MHLQPMLADDPFKVARLHLAWDYAQVLLTYSSIQYNGLINESPLRYLTLIYFNFFREKTFRRCRNNSTKVVCI